MEVHEQRRRRGPASAAGERRAASGRGRGRRRRRARRRRAPTAPQPTICHGVYGPWPKKKFDASAATAPTAKPGAPPSDVAGEQHDVGRRLDARDRRERDAARARRARRASRRARAPSRVGCARSYQAKPAASAIDEQGERGHLPGHGWGTSRVSRLRSSSAPSSGSSAPSTMRAVSVAKYQPPVSTSAVGPSAIDAPVGEQHDAVGEARRRTRGRAWRRGRRAPSAARALQARGEVALGAAVQAARGLVEADDRRARSPGAEHDREREALALAAGEVARVAVLGDVEAGGRARVGGRLVADALVQQVVAGVLEQQRDAPVGADLAARRLEQPGGVAQQRRLARAVAAHQRDPLARARARGRRRAGSPCRRRARARRRAARAPAASPAASAPPRTAAASGASRGWPRRLRRCLARFGVERGRGRAGVARASLTPDGGGRRPARAKRRAAGVSRAGACSAAQARNSRGAASQARRAVGRRRGRGRRRPGSARGGARRGRSSSPTPR